MKAKPTVDYVPDSRPHAVPYDATSNAFGCPMAARPSLGGRESKHNAIRSLDNQVTDDQGTVHTLNNEVGLTTLDMPLTQFAVGYPGEGSLQATLDALCPVVPAGPTFQYIVMSEKENWIDMLANDGDIRVIGGQFAQLKPGMKRADGSVDEKGLTILIDHRLGGQLPAVRQSYVAMLKDILLRTDIRRVFATLDANITPETSENWGPANTTRDPDGSIITLNDASGDARGISNNIVVFGGGASLKRKKSYRLLKAAGSTLDNVTKPEELAQEYEVEKVVTVNQRRQNGLAKAKLINDVVYGFYAGGTTILSPTNLARFTDMSGGNAFQVFVKEEARYTELTVWHSNRIICTSNLGMYKLPVTFT